MNKINPEKLYVTFEPGITPSDPIYGRKYTLTHSDQTGELFLDIGLQYAYEKISDIRDEVLAVWVSDHGNPYVYVYVDVKFGPIKAKLRNQIVRRKLPLALEAIRYGDNQLYLSHPHLDPAPIWVHFDSINPKYNKIEYWGNLKDFG